MAQAQQRLAAGCAVQLAFISFALTPLLFAQLLLLSLQLTCEACCILLIACTILTAGVLCCMLCMLFVLCSLVGVVLRLVRWVRRGLLLSARELAVGSSRELTWLEVLGVTLLEVSAASTLTPGPLVRSLLAMVWSALGVVIILVGVLAIASVTAVALAISRMGHAALALLVSLAARITHGAHYMGATVASRCVPSSGLAAALVDLTWWSAVLAWVMGQRLAASAARRTASTGWTVRCRWEARPTMVPLLLSVSPLMLAALAVALLVRCGDDVGTACLRSAAWPPDPPRSSARIRARARADPADPVVQDRPRRNGRAAAARRGAVAALDAEAAAEANAAANEMAALRLLLEPPPPAGAAAPPPPLRPPRPVAAADADVAGARAGAEDVAEPVDPVEPEPAGPDDDGDDDAGGDGGGGDGGGGGEPQLPGRGGLWPIVRAAWAAVAIAAEPFLPGNLAAARIAEFAAEQGDAGDVVRGHTVEEWLGARWQLRRSLLLVGELGVGRGGGLLPLAVGEVVRWGPQQYLWDGAFFAPSGVLVDDPLSWFFCPLIADALELTTYPDHLVPRPADTNRLPDFPRDDGDMTWTHLVWLCREALRAMYERLENGVAAADDLRGHWPGGFQERLVGAMEGQWTARHGPRHAGESTIGERIEMMALMHARARIADRDGGGAADGPDGPGADGPDADADAGGDVGGDVGGDAGGDARGDGARAACEGDGDLCDQPGCRRPRGGLPWCGWCDSCPICFVELGMIASRIYTFACGHAHCMDCLVSHLSHARRSARGLTEAAAQAALANARAHGRNAMQQARAAAAAGEAAARPVLEAAQRCSVCRADWSVPERLAVAAALRVQEIAERQQALLQEAVGGRAEVAGRAAAAAAVAAVAAPIFVQPELPPAEPGAAPMPGEWEQIDGISAVDCCVSVFSRLDDVPRAFRTHWARATVDVLEYVSDAQSRGDAEALTRGLKWFLVYHDMLLRTRVHSRVGRRAGASDHIFEDRFRWWRDGQRGRLVHLWRAERDRALARRHARAPRGAEDPQVRQARCLERAKTLIEDGELSRACRLLHDTGMAPLTPGVVDQLRRKHPPRRTPMPAELPGVFSRVTVSLTETFRKLRRRRGTGPSGMRNEYLRALVAHFDDPRANQVMPRYDLFATSLANAELPSWFYLLYGSSRLVPLVKAEAREPGGDPDARPVAVGEVGLCAITRTVYAEAASVLADYLAPHQVAVGVPGGLDILVHGVRAFLRAQPEHVVVRLDLRNAYNEIDRCVALRRLAAVPELAHLAPLFHALHAPMARLQLSSGRGLFDDVAGRAGDSEEGVRQGSAESSAVFCVGIAPELAALDRELAAAGGVARGDADDIYACGPPWVVFEAVARFAETVERELGLVMRPEKLLCFSHNLDLATCPERVAHLRVPVGILRDEADEPLLVPCGRSGEPRQVRGITVGGVPVGEEDYATTLRPGDRGATFHNYSKSVVKTVSRPHPHDHLP